MPNTHCLPSGSLGINELPTMPISTATVTETKGSSPYRGVVAVTHGLVQSASSVVIPAAQPTDSFFLGVGGAAATLATSLNADGWVFLQVPYNGDNYNGAPSFGIASDINASGAGSRYRTNISHWWAHVRAYVATTYGPSWPVIPFGVSWGALHTIIVAQDYTTSAPPAMVAICPATVVSNLGSGLWAGATISTSTGVDISTTALNSYAGPTLVAYGTSDGVVGWSATSSPVSNTDAMITNAQGAGKPCTRLATHYTFHGYDSTDVTTIQTWFTNNVDPICPKTHTIGN